MGITLCYNWYDVLDVVDDNFVLFQTECRCSNPAKFIRFVKFNQDRLVMRNPVLCCLFWLGWSLGGLWPKGDVLHVRHLPVVKNRAVVNSF